MMAGSKVIQMIEADAVGDELIRRGWCQGSLLPAASAQKSWLVFKSVEVTPHNRQEAESEPASSGTWILQQELLDETDLLLIVSQTCDIKRSPTQEPYVEAVRTYWTDDRSVIHEAGKNSVRRFLLFRRTSTPGAVEGLIADATVRVQIAKAALLEFTPLTGFNENNKMLQRRLRQWLTKRYNRPALPDDLVIAVQRPIVKAIDKLRATDDRHRILDGISELLFIPYNETIPYQIDMLFIRDERVDAPEVSDEDAAKLASWIADILKRGGNAELVHWEILSTKNISVYDYSNAYELPTDQYSLDEDDYPSD